MKYQPSPSSRRIRRGRSGFTLVEILITASITAVLASLLLPVLSSARAAARQTQCLNGLRAWGYAITGYAADNSGRVQFQNWQNISSGTRYYENYFGETRFTVQGKSVTATEYFRRCPAVAWDGQGNAPVHYAFVRPLPHEPSVPYYILTKATQPSKMLTMIESVSNNGTVIGSSSDLTNAVSPIAAPTASLRHRGSVNLLFADSHVSTATWNQLDINTPEGAANVATMLKLQP